MLDCKTLYFLYGNSSSLGQKWHCIAWHAEAIWGKEKLIHTKNKNVR